MGNSIRLELASRRAESLPRQIAEAQRKLCSGEGPITAFVLMFRAARLMQEVRDPEIVANALNDAMIEYGFLSSEGLQLK